MELSHVFLVLGCIMAVSAVDVGTTHFYYDPQSTYLVAVTKIHRYMAVLTRDEQDHVHTIFRGMPEMELTMIRDWIGKLPEIHMTHDHSLSANINRWCDDRDLVFLDRGIPVITAFSMIGR